MARILICDDSKTILTLLERRLQEGNYAVIGKAKDGIECLKLCEQLKPDLILLDVTMPNKDGAECLTELRQQFPAVKVIMLSAIMDEALIDRCLKLGAKHFISKNNLYKQEEFQTLILPLITNALAAA